MNFSSLGETGATNFRILVKELSLELFHKRSCANLPTMQAEYSLKQAHGHRLSSKQFVLMMELIANRGWRRAQFNWRRTGWRTRSALASSLASALPKLEQRLVRRAARRDGKIDGRLDS